MKKLLIICFSMVIFSCNNLNLNDSSKKLKIKSNFLIYQDVGIKNTPITNREYLIFLCWNIDVYGYSYPERIVSLLPISSRKNFNQSGNIIGYQDAIALIKNIDDPTLKSYTFNPKFLDYPVIGLTKNQTFEILKWLSDRYNENVLISRGILNFNPYQLDEDCWVLESYLTDKYVGSVRKNLPDQTTGGERPPRWADLFFRPTFRLPFESEIKRIESNFEEPFKLKAYEFKKTNFLWIWNDYYLVEKNNQLTLKIDENLTFQGTNPSNVFDISELVLEKGKLDNNCYQNLKYLEDQSNKDKNEFGHRHFLILGETDSHQVITGSFKEFENGNEPKNLISWVVFNKKMKIND